MSSTTLDGTPLRDDALEDATHARPAQWAVFLLTLCATVVLIVYFRNLWALLASGPHSWVLPELGQTLRFTGLPYVREALLRAATAAAATTIVLAAIAAAGRVSTRALLPESATPTERLVIGYAFGVGVLAYSLLALAWMGVYRRPVVATLLMIAAITFVVWQWSGARSRTRASRASVGDLQKLVARDDLLWAFITVMAVLLAGFCALAPETEYDALWYHLELPRRWLAAGRPVDDVTEYISLYPLTWELLFGGALALDGPVAARLLHWTTLPLCAVVVGLITRRINHRSSPWLAAAVFVTAPTVFWEATTTYVDLALALHAGVGVYALIRADGVEEQRWLVIAGLQFGLAAATKHLGLVALASALIVFAAARSRRRPLVQVARSALLVAALALIVPSPWYVRAWRASGNPMFPELYAVFGARPSERWSSETERGLTAFKDHFGTPRTFRNTITLPWHMTMHAARYGGTLGPLLLAFLPLGILASRRGAARGLLAGAALYLAVWASPLSSFQMRFLVPLWVALAPLIAAGMQLPLALGVLGRAGRFVLQAAFAALLIVNLPPWTPLHERDRQAWSNWLTHVVREPPVGVVLGGISEDEWLREQIRSYAAWQWIDAHTSSSSRVLTFFGGDHFYTHRPRLWSESVTARPATWEAVDGHGAPITATMQRLGLSYVLAPSEELRTSDHKRLDILQPATLQRHFDLVYTDRWTVVYRVRSTSAEAGRIDQR
jgi:hypothetical protein